MKNRLIGMVLALTTIAAMVLVPASPVAAAIPNADYYSSVGPITPGGVYTVPEAVNTPDDDKFVQLGEGASVVLKFPANWFAVRSGSTSPDLQVDIFDAVAPSSAEIFVSSDGFAWTSVGIFADNVDISIDLDATTVGPVKYVKVFQDPSAPYDPDYSDLRFDLDGVIALTPLQFWTVTVGARDNVAIPPPPPPASILTGVPIRWVQTIPLPTPPPPITGTTNTFFPRYVRPGGTLTLEAPLSYTSGSDSYVFRFWLVGTPPAIPTTFALNQRAVVFTPNENKTAMAIFQKTSFGPIYPQANDVNPVGISHKVWVDLTAIAGEPTAPTLGGIPVRFVIEGPNAGASGVAYTDDAGRATFEYYGNEGMDRIWAYIDGDGDQVRDSNEPRSSNTALKFWVRHFVTGGGNIKDGKKVTWTFSGAVGVLPEGGAVGSFQIVDQSTKEVYSVDEFVVLSFYGSEAGSPTATHNTARFRGVGTRSSDGARVEVVIILEDNGEPGKDADKIAAEVARVGAGPNNVNVIPLIGNVYVPERYPPPPAPPTTPPPSELVTISGGNIQVHNMPNP